MGKNDGYEKLIGDEEDENQSLTGASNRPKGLPALCCQECVQPDLYDCCEGCCWNCGRTYRAGFEGALTLKFLSITCGPDSTYLTRTISIILTAVWIPIFMALATIEGTLAMIWILFVDILWRFIYMLFIYLSACVSNHCSHHHACEVVNQEGRSYLPCFPSLAEDPGTELRCGLEPDFLC